MPFGAPFGAPFETQGKQGKQGKPFETQGKPFDSLRGSQGKLAVRKRERNADWRANHAMRTREKEVGISVPVFELITKHNGGSRGD